MMYILDLTLLLLGHLIVAIGLLLHGAALVVKEGSLISTLLALTQYMVTLRP